MIDYKKFTKNSIQYLVEYIKANNLKSLVLGISGGIDSTVTAAIASEACDKSGIPLIGRSLPAHTNNPDEINTAKLVGEAFCSDFKEVAIEKIYAKVADEIELNEGKMTPLQLGNIKARLRMIYLYNLASIYKGCVLDTDNKSEHELGFWTIHGDVGDLNCGIIHLWKTEVYELARHLCISNYLYEDLAKLFESDDSVLYEKYELQAKAIIESIKLVPTDGNGVMYGGDCAQFGLENYQQVDDVLKTMYFPDNKPDKDNKMEYLRLIDSYNEQGVDKVMLLHQNSAFKRSPQPIYPSKEKLEI